MEKMFKISSKSFNSNLYRFTDFGLYMFREQKVDHRKVYTEVNGPLELVALIEASSQIEFNGIKYDQAKELGNFGLYIPRFSIFSWRSKSGEVRWHGFNIQYPEMNYEFRKPTLFNWDGMLLPQDANLLYNMVLQNKNKTELTSEKILNPIVIKAKKLLDSNYKYNISIQEISSQLNCSWSYLSREFKKFYGISLVEYRTRIRLFEVLILLNKGCTLTSACLNSGFGSISQFNVQFKKYLNYDPSYFTGRRKKMMKEEINFN